MVDEGALAAIGAAIVGFGIVAFVFRIQRELQLQEARDLRLQELQDTLGSRLQEEIRKLGWRLFLQERQETLDPELQEEIRKLAWKLRWIPWANRLLIVAVTVALLLVLFPIALAEDVSDLWGARLPAAACSASLIALAGYIPALLAHYPVRSR